MAHTGPHRVSRESAIDFARGAAMLLVFLAHFSEEQWVSDATGGVLLLLHRVAMIATPTFVLVSGLTLSFVLWRTGSEGLSQRKLRVLDRALFLIVVVHIVLVVSEDLLAPNGGSLREVFITDMVALNLLLGLILLPGTSIRLRLLLGFAWYCLGWMIHFSWHPLNLGAAVAEEILTGPNAGHALDYGFPVFQWAGVFLLGTVMGEGFAKARSSEARQSWAIRTMRQGLAAVLAAVVLKTAVIVSPLARLFESRPEYTEAASLLGKLPPSPVYLLFFGGIGACLIAAATLISMKQILPIATEWVAVLGRNSLVAFVLQSYVFRDLVGRVSLGERPWTWPIALAGSTLLIWSGTWMWDRVNGNRWLTVGVGGLGQGGRRLGGEAARRLGG